MQSRARASFLRLSILASFSFFAISLPAQETPQLRLPDTVAPTSYRAELRLDPNKPDFSGSISIQVTLKQPARTIWLNATELNPTEASVVSAKKTFSGKAVPEGTDFLKVQLQEELPAGPAEVRIRYSGRVRQRDRWYCTSAGPNTCAAPNAMSE